jgi:putative effector of murein hydrolase LrgA (UPF0299 family)
MIYQMFKALMIILIAVFVMSIATKLFNVYIGAISGVLIIFLHLYDKAKDLKV